MSGTAPVLPPLLRATSIRIGRGIDPRGVVYTLEERTAGSEPPGDGTLLFGEWSGTPTLMPLLFGVWSQGSPPETDLDETTWSDAT